MILVDIYIAGTETKHDFWLDKHALIDEATEEIGAMLSGGEEKRGDFLLCSYERQQILPGGSTLSECGITNGSRLLFL